MNQHKSIARRLLPLAVAALFCSLFFTLIQCQITIGSKQQELAAVREQLSAQQAQNEELGRALADGKDAIIERSARADGGKRGTGSNRRLAYLVLEAHGSAFGLVHRGHGLCGVTNDADS